MTVQYSQLPTYDSWKGLSRVWYTFFSNLFVGKPPDSESPVKLTPSPFTYTATRKGFAIVQGGTVSMVSWARGTTNHNTGLTAGAFPLSQGDSLVITYSGTPNVTFVPQ